MDQTHVQESVGQLTTKINGGNLGHIKLNLFEVPQ